LYTPSPSVVSLGLLAPLRHNKLSLQIRSESLRCSSLDLRSSGSCRTPLVLLVTLDLLAPLCEKPV